MSVQDVSYPCSCGATITEWQRFDLGGIEVVHGDGDSAPSFFVADEEIGRGRALANAERIDAFVAEVHERGGIARKEARTPSQAAQGAMIGGIQRAIRMLEAER